LVVHALRLYSNQLEEALFNMTQEANLTVYTTGAVVDQKSFLANYTVNTTVLSRCGQVGCRTKASSTPLSVRRQRW